MEYDLVKFYTKYGRRMFLHVDMHLANASDICETSPRLVRGETRTEERDFRVCLYNFCIRLEDKWINRTARLPSATKSTAPLTSRCTDLMLSTPPHDCNSGET